MINNRVSEVRTTQNETDKERRIFTFKATYIVWIIFGILEALLAMRFLLKIFAANPASPFAVFIYGITSIFLFPFRGLLATPTFGAVELEATTLIAMIVYGLIAWGIERIVWVIFYRPRGSVVTDTTTTSSDQHTHQ